MRRMIGLIIAAFIPFLLSSCAPFNSSRPQEFGQREGDTLVSQNGWWYAVFQIHWPGNEEPQWHTDLVLAHKVISPLLLQHRERIELWRFHRRAVKDQAGHQFSFIFYSSPQTAKEIFSTLTSDPLLEEMKANGLLIQNHYDDTSAIVKPHAEDTSDRRWSLPVQRSWPYYIMGVCEMWLHLISEVAEELAPDVIETSSFQDCLAFYKRVDESITETWRKEGRHAFLHHLNAMFQYEPLLVYEERLMRF